MNAPLRRGACPALSAPMRTGDGLLVRLNPTEAALSPAALAGLCLAADRHGNGIVEITARGSFQVRGLMAASVEPMAADVDALGISVRTGVPVETGPLAGLDPAAVADPRALAQAVRTRLAVAGLATRLGPKVSVVIDDGGAPWMAQVAADVRLTAVRGPVGRPAWRLAVAGDAGGALPLGECDEAAAANAAVAILSAVADLGQEARARDLQAEAAGSIARFAGAMPLSPHFDTPTAAHVGANVIATHALSDGRFALAAALPFGQVEASRLADFVALAGQLGAAEFRLAPRRVLLTMCPDGATARGVREAAHERGFIVDPNDPLLSLAACPGSPACASSHIATRTIAGAFADDAGDLLDGSFILHVSGCAKGCAHPTKAALVLVGVGGPEAGAMLVANGTASSPPFDHIPADAASAALAGIAALIRNERKVGETTASVLKRLEKAKLAAAFLQEAR